MEEYNDFTYEPEEIETELKSEEIRKVNQNSNATKNKKDSQKSNSNNNIIGNANNVNGNSVLEKKTKSNNTTENYQREFEINYSDEIKKIERELDNNEHQNKQNTIIKENADYNNNKDNNQELDTERLDCLIEKVLNNNYNDIDNDIDINHSNRLDKSKSPKGNYSKGTIEIKREDQQATRLNNINSNNNNANDDNLIYIQTEPNNKKLKVKDKRMKSASSILRNTNSHSHSHNNSNKRLFNPKDDSYQFLSNELELLINTPAKTATELSLQNKIMIHYLTKLNAVLSKQINTKTHQSEIPNCKLRQKSAKAISIYQKEYFKLEARLKQLSDANYETKLIERLSKLKKDISYYESENLKLKQSEKSSEVMLSTQTKHILNSTIELRRLEMDYEQLQRQYAIIMEKVVRNKEIIRDNDNKINQLREFRKNMEGSAKETYGIIAFDNVNEIQRKNEENKEKKSQLEKNYEILEKASNSNKKKYESEISKNEKMIYLLKKNKMELQIEISKMDAEHKKMALPGRKQMNTPVTSSISLKGDRGDKCEVYSPTKEKEKSNGDRILPEIKSNIDNSRDTNQMKISKDKVIEQLEKKAEVQKKEKPIDNNMPGLNSSNSVIGKNIMNKPSFAFTQIKKEDIRHTNSNLNGKGHRQEILISDISEIQNNTNNNNQSYSNKEVIEEINIDSLRKDKNHQSQRKTELLIDTIPEFLNDLKDTKSNENDNKNNQMNENSNEPYWLNDNDKDKSKQEEELKEDRKEDMREKEKEEEEQYEDKFDVHIDITEKSNTNVLNDNTNGAHLKSDQDEAEEIIEFPIINKNDNNEDNIKQETDNKQLREHKNKNEEEFNFNQNEEDKEKNKPNPDPTVNKTNSEIEVAIPKSPSFNPNKLKKTNVEHIENFNEFEDLEELLI